jgi:nucleoside 2-deoxyribosyltransferase
MPVKWESHSAPLLGNRPQAIINEQLVNECDLLVGVFWTRIGTHTGVSVSGTAEEIEHFVAQNKPVMLYFSQSPVDPEKIEIDQFTVLKTFKEKMRLKGLTESYSGIPDFRQKFSRQLAINLNAILTKAAAELSEKAATSARRRSDPVIVPRLPVGSRGSGSASALSTEQIHEYLMRAVSTVAGPDGWSPVAAVGSYLKTYTPVDYHSLGFEKLNKFLESTKLFDLRIEQKSSRAKAVDSAYVRMKK